ncbi:adenosylcobinamide-GDP ribazoletransferase [Tuwongella immobilis]|uniref:Adenosylcobinamide-GDP ribazoletransferase n=1 Tax=Tuwongella immobilis TaxID=692036 RepID=A0A6C2YTI3_9BACT|nr:adenosylcobinamide-GDP ribazoletransferase [Tuwongella immobilis]VIP05020.1 cobalamin synthase : Adenosylcobinamide-GDP ribazoletransferase OS=Isosphaera pallida (strain ATCC 43644 / DSM 9630 / IS1B) GN=cobS PE=3 SV=1: CobS [Tuwongella immobilis]VTS07398.1 cobalamin synthase : Adenosylcobinamide-GDP ribazoletransferase OS=Isosphaera pallida (strain ATCC 43644 / DSM 9630 / IS1B) GN=cobS PE=3 SV=1: CobS [Tuwongella immobilis]
MTQAPMGGWRGWRTERAAFLAAVQFLTRIPVPAYAANADEAKAALRRGVIYFPLVGLIVGTITGITLALASSIWPILVAVLLALVIEAWMTGAFHEDAVADFCDAFGGGWTRESILTILRDSRIGSFGTVGLGLALALRVSLLTTLPTTLWIIASCIAAGALGRSLGLVMMVMLPPVTDREGLAKDLAQQLAWREVGLGMIFTAVTMVPLLLLSPLAVLLALFASAGWVLWLCGYLRRRIGGVTGDCLGFATYVGQLLVLLAVVAMLGMK